MAPVLLIRAGTPQRKGFRNKLAEWVQIPVSPDGVRCPGAGQTGSRKTVFRCKTEKPQGFTPSDARLWMPNSFSLPSSANPGGKIKGQPKEGM